MIRPLTCAGMAAVLVAAVMAVAIPSPAHASNSVTILDNTVTFDTPRGFADVVTTNAGTGVVAYIDDVGGGVHALRLRRNTGAGWTSVWLDMTQPLGDPVVDIKGDSPTQIVQDPNGVLMLFAAGRTVAGGSWDGTYRWTSTDDGATWTRAVRVDSKPLKGVGSDNQPQGFYLSFLDGSGKATYSHFQSNGAVTGPNPLANAPIGVDAIEMGRAGSTVAATVSRGPNQPPAYIGPRSGTVPECRNDRLSMASDATVALLACPLTAGTLTAFSWDASGLHPQTTIANSIPNDYDLAMNPGEPGSWTAAWTNNDNVLVRGSSTPFRRVLTGGPYRAIQMPSQLVASRRWVIGTGWTAGGGRALWVTDTEASVAPKAGFTRRPAYSRSKGKANVWVATSQPAEVYIIFRVQVGRKVRFYEKQYSAVPPGARRLTIRPPKKLRTQLARRGAKLTLSLSVSGVGGDVGPARVRARILR